MVPCRNMLLRVMASFVAKFVAMGAGSPIHLVPIANDFSPGSDMLPGELTPSDFLGPLGTRIVDPAMTRGARDPLNEDEVLMLAFEDAVCDRQMADVADNPLPRTIHGYMLITADGTQIIGAHKFDNPITYTAITQLLYWGEISFRYPQNAVR